MLPPAQPEGSSAAAAIKQALARLEDYPEIGRPHAEEPGLRELVIEFGDSGYSALYRYEADEDIVLALRHQKEAGYGL